MCDMLVIVRRDGVWFAKNSDRDPNEAQQLDWQPATRHPPGSRVRCTWIEIPQVEQTHAVLLSRPFWMWGAEMGANEHGVVIGNVAVFTRQPYATTGLTGMDLVRLALERSAAAEQAVEVLLQLLEQHGQGGGCGHENRRFTYHNSFLIADPHSAFLVETAGRYWATERITTTRAVSNGLTIPGFADRHADRLRGFVAACSVRRRRVEEAAGQAESLSDLFATLRDHGPYGTTRLPHYSPIHGALSGACVHAGGLIAATQTTASWVSELSPGRVQHWATGTSAPCISLFKPVSVNKPLDLGPWPGDRFDERCHWWRHEQLHRAVMRDPEELAPRVKSEFTPLERAWLESSPSPEEAWSLAEEAMERAWKSVSRQIGTDQRPWWVRRYWARRNQQAGLPSL